VKKNLQTILEKVDNIAIDEGKNTYYEFRLKNGEFRYWKNISDKNFKKLGL
jgi:hypothetical protein